MNNFVDLLALGRLPTKFDLLPTTKFGLATTLHFCMTQNLSMPILDHAKP